MIALPATVKPGSRLGSDQSCQGRWGAGI